MKVKTDIKAGGFSDYMNPPWRSPGIGGFPGPNF